MSLTLNLGALWPVLAPALGVALVLLVDVALPKLRQVHLGLAALALLGGAAATLPGLRLPAGDRLDAFCLPGGQCLYGATSLTSGLQLLALGAAGVVLALTWVEWNAEERGSGRTAVHVVLLLAATAGIVAVPAARDLGSLLVALELATLPTVGLVALERRRSRETVAVEGAVTLLITSLVSFALLAMGAALWVAATGTGLLTPAAAGAAVQAERTPLLVLAAVFALAGIGFKLSAVPFHAWTPPTYGAAPLPITVYLAGASKVAALGGLVVVVQALAGAADFTLVAVGIVAALSMTLGNVVALRQNDLIQLLAWSAIAQAGWMMLPLSAVSNRAVHAAAGYLAVYVVATLLAFTVVLAVGQAVRIRLGADEEEPDEVTQAVSRRSAGSAGHTLEDHRGLLRAHPWTATALAFALLTLAGLPPAVVGLVAKVVALRPVAGDGTWWLAVVAALNVALGIAVYLRWLAVLVARPPVDEHGLPVRSADDGIRVTESWSGPHPWVIGLLTALLVVGSISPVGIF